MIKQNISALEASNFTTYFSGNSDAFGQYVPPKVLNQEGEKQKGDSYTEKKLKLTPELYVKHLEGIKGLGIIPINADNNVRFCVIDIDVYPLNVGRYQDAINAFRLPFHIFKSKSGGAHLYLFFREDVKAENLVPLMKKWVRVFGLPENTEVFPKQRRLRAAGGGNWINLPYFGGTRKMINEGCVEITLAEALDRIEDKLISYDELKAIYEELPISSGPPCLQSIYIMNEPDIPYTMYLFNLAVYLKGSRPNDWQEFLYKANGRLEGSLDQERIEKQVIQSHERKTYSYRCSEEPICSRCDKAECETRKFGKGGDEISDFTFEDMTQVLSEPPYYKWIVNGTSMIFESEQELRDQNRFADYSMRNLHKVPNRLKNTKWIAILNKAFEDIQTEKIALKDDISPGAIFAELIYEFLFEQQRAKTKQQVSQLGRVWEDVELGVLHFRKTHLIKHLNNNNFTLFRTTMIQAKLKDYGATPGSLYINKNVNTVRTWKIPTTLAAELGDGHFDEDDEVDFEHLIEDKEEF